MKLTIVVLIILHGVTCIKWINFPHQSHCNQQIINYYRKEYEKEIYSEIDDLKDIKTTHSSCTESVEHTLRKLRHDIEYARPGNEIVNQCLDGLDSRTDNIANSYKDVLRKECYLNIKGQITTILLASRIATSQVEICLKNPGSSCRSIKRCCDKVEDSFEDQNIDREVRRLVYGYKQCVWGECQKIRRIISEIKTDITTCTPELTEAPTVTTGVPQPPTTAVPPVTTAAPQPPTTVAPAATIAASQPPTTVVPAVTTTAPQPPTTVAPAVTTAAPQLPTTAALAVTTEVPQPPTTAIPAVTTTAPQSPTTAAPAVTTTAPKPPTTAAPAVTTAAPRPTTTAAPFVTTEAPQSPTTAVPAVTIRAPQSPQTEAPIAPDRNPVANY